MNTPKIRFKGFEDDWEQRKLDDWGTFYYGKSCPKWSVTQEATIPCIRYGELYTKFGAKIDRVYSYTDMPADNLRFSKGTEVLIPRVGEDPMDYNHCTWLSLPNIAIGEMISVFNTEQDPYFSAIMFNATLQKEFAIRVEGGSVTNLYFEKLKNIDVLYPSLDEQERIATYFGKLDHLITLHQRKCDETKQLKKFMLQKMFPKNGEKNPEIRFEGFTDDWEQRKLGDICEQLSQTIDPKRTPNARFEEYSMPAFDQNMKATVVEGSTMNSTRKIISKECLLINKLNVRKKRIWLVEKPSDNAVCSAEFIPICSDEINLRYLKYFTLNDSFTKYLEDCSSGSSNSQKRVTPDIIMNAEIIAPVYAEQKKIGDYFRNLDHLITLHQRKCEKLKELKKFMLQNMFV